MRTVLETGCFLLGILILFYYVGVVLYAGLTASFAWFWLLSGIALLLLRYALHYQDLHPGTPLRFVTGAILVLLAAALIAALVTGSRIVLAMYAGNPSEQEPSYVIVLGAQVKGTSPSRALKRRLDRAAQYAEAHPGAILILSGGQGADEEISEAECMYRYLTAAGVPEERLLLEDGSTSTQENLEFSAELIRQQMAGTKNDMFSVSELKSGNGIESSGQDSEEEGIQTEISSGIYSMQSDIVSEGTDAETGTKSERIIEIREPVAILSNNFHIYRALLLARKAGYQNAFGVPASSDAGMLPHNIIREICALLVIYARGIL
ncbi:MAG: YdcF family protein [Lachnospiraceae bacterium]|nr:YdcF family protein [Lachnospiraceae bacterium]